MAYYICDGTIIFLIKFFFFRSYSFLELVQYLLILDGGMNKTNNITIPAHRKDMTPKLPCFSQVLAIKLTNNSAIQSSELFQSLFQILQFRWQEKAIIFDKVIKTKHFSRCHFGLIAIAVRVSSIVTISLSKWQKNGFYSIDNFLLDGAVALWEPFDAAKPFNSINPYYISVKLGFAHFYP